MRNCWSSAQGGGAQKKRKQKGEDFKLRLPTSTQLTEHGLDNHPNSSLQVAHESSDLQTSNTVDVTNLGDLSQASQANSKCLKLITYSRRSKKAGHKGKKRVQTFFNWNLQYTGFCNNSSSTVESAETGFGRKISKGASSGEGFLPINGKQNGSVNEGMRADPSRTDKDSNKVKTFDSETNKKAKRRGRKKMKKNKTSIHDNQISVSESRESENIDSTKNIDLHREISSKSGVKKRNNTNRTTLEEEDNGLQRNSTIFPVNKDNLPGSPKYNLRASVLNCTYPKRRKNSGQWGKNSHKCSHLNSQVNENDLCNRSLSTIDAAEAVCERKENNSASFSESFLHMEERDGGSSLENMQTLPTSLILSDVNSKIHEANRMHPERIGKHRRRRNKKNKTPMSSNPMPISETDMRGSIKSEINDSVEMNDLDPEICLKSEVDKAKLNSGKTHARRRNRAKKERPTVSEGISLCDAFPKQLEPKNEGCQLKCEISIQAKSNGEKRFPSSVKDVTDDVTPHETVKENITVDYMTMSLQKASISHGKKKLLILDLNGLLVDVICEPRALQRAPLKVAGKSVYKRPFCEEFLEFCFERFDVGVWSSRKRRNIDVVVNFLFREKRSQLLFCWDLSKCTTTGFMTLENVHKPLVLKELKKLWNKEDEDLPWEKGDYSPSNTLLIDDSPYKALGNPPYTAIFPSPYDHRNANDNALGLDGDLRVYLEGLTMTNNVQRYVEEHPFGQHAISPADRTWGFYLKIIETMNPHLLLQPSVTDGV